MNEKFMKEAIIEARKITLDLDEVPVGSNYS